MKKKKTTRLRSSSKNLIILLVFIVIIVVIVIMFRPKHTPATPTISPPLVPTATPTNTPITTNQDTTNWKIYKNKNFSFKYPANWEPDSGDKGEVFFFEMNKPHRYPTQDPTVGNQMITVSNYRTSSSPELPDKDLYPNMQAITIDGKQGVMDTQWGTFFFWYGANDKIRVQIDRFHADRQSLTTILSTFQFTK